jgi:Flagellar hook-length control protein FliK
MSPDRTAPTTLRPGFAPRSAAPGAPADGFAALLGAADKAAPARRATLRDGGMERDARGPDPGAAGRIDHDRAPDSGAPPSPVAGGPDDGLVVTGAAVAPVPSAGPAAPAEPAPLPPLGVATTPTPAPVVAAEADPGVTPLPAPQALVGAGVAAETMPDAVPSPTPPAATETVPRVPSSPAAAPSAAQAGSPQQLPGDAAPTPTTAPPPVTSVPAPPAETPETAIAVAPPAAEETAPGAVPAPAEASEPATEAPASPATTAPAPSRQGAGEQHAAPQDDRPATAAPVPPAAQPSAAAPAAPSLTPLAQRAAPLHQARAVAQVLQVALERGISQAKLNLRPAELGGIEIRLQTSSAGVTAQVIADSPEAARLLQQAAEDLRRSLERHDVTLLSLDVSTAGDDRPDGSAGASADPAERARLLSAHGVTSEAVEADEPPTVLETVQLPDGLHIDVLA